MKLAAGPVAVALFLAGTFTLLDTAPVLARGSAANIMNSPGYQRRLQESRQQLSQPEAQPAPVYRTKTRSHRRHRHR